MCCILEAILRLKVRAKEELLLHGEVVESEETHAKSLQEPVSPIFLSPSCNVANLVMLETQQLYFQLPSVVDSFPSKCEQNVGKIQ